MDVVSHCPLSVASIRWQPRIGLHALTVVVKATYQLAPGTSALATQQDEVNAYENHWNDDATRSLYAPSDLVPFKPQSEVLLVGYAYAAQEVPTRKLTARLIAAGIDKSINVHGDRIFGKDGVVRDGASFTKLPIRYERAAFGSTNPVGMRLDATPDRSGGVALPNLVPPGPTSFTSGETIESIGFGPIAAAWPERARRLPKHLSELPLSWNERPLPEGLDPSYFNAAPTDQRVAQLVPDEQIRLEYLHPKHSSLSTRLAGVVPKVQVERANGQDDLLMIADTLWIDTDRFLCTLTWRGQIRLEHPEAQGRVIVSMSRVSTDRETVQRSAPNIAPPPGSVPRPSLDKTLPPPASNPGSVPRPSLEQTMSLPASSPGSARRPVLDTKRQDLSSQSPSRSSEVSPPPMPFVPAKPGVDRADTRLAPRTASLTDRIEVGGTYVFTSNAPPPAPLPFVGASEPPRPAIPPSAQLAAPALTNDIPPTHVVAAPAAPAMTVGQAAMHNKLNASAVPNAPAPDPMSGMLSTHASSDPRSEASTSTPQFGSVASLRQAGFVAGMPPSSVTAASHAAADPAIYGAGMARDGASLARTRTPVELLWYDPAFVENIRKDRVLRAILDERNKAAPKKKSDPKTDNAPRPNGPDPKEQEDVAAILTLGQAQGIEALGAAMSEAIDEMGTFRPPLVLLSGDLEFPFDEVETLKATVAAVTPLSTGDKKLKELIDAVGELMRTPWLQAAGSVTDRLTAQIKETFTSGNRLLPSGFLETHTERILLENRHYQKRALLGQTWIRALFSSAGTWSRVPTYIPHGLARDLPMYVRFSARLIAEVRTQVDQYETHSCALRVVALGRTLGAAVRK